MKIHHQLASLLGYDLIRQKKSHLEIKDHLPKIFDKLKIDTVIDVGANEGQFLKLVLDSGFGGRIFSFEPIPDLGQNLTLRYKDNSNVKIFNLALGEAESILKLNVFKSSVFSSFKNVTNFSKKNFPDHVKEESSVSVEVKRLDQVLFAELQTSQRIFLKVDTQGFDLEVLKGAKGILEKVYAINFECNVIPIYENTPNYLETLNYFNDLGFVPSGFFPVSRTNDNHALIEFDVVMVKKPIVSEIS